MTYRITITQARPMTSEEAAVWASSNRRPDNYGYAQPETPDNAPEKVERVLETTLTDAEWLACKAAILAAS